MTDTSTIKDFIVKNFLYGEDNGFASSASLLDTGIVDSTGFLQIITHIEKEFGFKVKENEILPSNFDSLDKIHAYIARKTNVKVELT